MPTMILRRFFLIIILFFMADLVQAFQWRQIKQQHFVIRFDASVSSDWAQEVLRKSEEYYDSIAQKIDYPRYHKFWTWDKRVEITIYPDRDTFLKETNQPAWSQGGAIHRPFAHKKRKIVTFKQEENFLEGLLPHEISHLILIDFIGEKTHIPIWFNEGVAQLYEKDKKEKADRLMRQLAAQNQYIPLSTLFQLDIRYEINPIRVAIFYAQSLSIIDYMISTYGSRRFGILCRAMRDGKSFEEALQSTYVADIGSADRLEKSWLSYMKN